MKEPSSAYVSSFNDVTTNNLSECIYELLNKLKNASHIALDFEFTGLCKPSIPDMNHRYVAMKEAVEKYSIVSFGLSIMQQTESASYRCDNFNFLTKKEGPLIFQDGTAEFLRSVGFDFERLETEGIRFSAPSDVCNEESQPDSPRDTRLIKLWKAIMSILKYSQIPIVFHNGLHDIMFLHHSFIDRLPKTLNGFLKSTAQNFPSGFYDTKLLSIETEFNATFLSYVFAKSDRLRQGRFGKEGYFEVVVNEPFKVELEQEGCSDKLKETATDVVDLTLSVLDRKRKTDEQDKSLEANQNKKQKIKETEICKAFATKGWCQINTPDHTGLGKCHDLQRIMDWEMGPSLYPQVYTSDPVQMKGMERAHAAHFDAYMTAFVFCYFKHTLKKEELLEHFNKIRLDFLPFALTIPNKITPKKSIFAD